MDYYDSLRKELMAKREAIRALTLQSKIQGDYYEALIKDFIRRYVPSNYEVGYGIIFDDKMRTSRECDVIIYSVRERRALFKSQDLVVVDSGSVRIVVQVKSVLTSETLKRAIINLEAVKKINSHILCWIVGFETDRLLKTLYFNAWRSKVIQFLHVFKCCDTENETLQKSQMKFFVDLLRHYTEPGIGSPPDLIIYNNGVKSPFFALPKNADEKRIKQILLDMYQKGFWNLWETGYNTYNRV